MTCDFYPSTVSLLPALFRFNGEPIYPELSPVTDFRESRCKQHELTSCSKGGFCNFMHLKTVSPEVYDRLYYNKKRHYGGSRGRDRNGNGKDLILVL